MLRALTAIALLTLTGCSQFPEVDQAVGSGASDQPYPKITPLGEIDTATANAALTPEEAAAFEAEVDALKRRGDQLRNQQLQ